MRILFIIPPFTQPNTAYPSVVQLSGYLNSKGYDSISIDLSLNVILKIFSQKGLENIFNELYRISYKEDDLQRFLALRTKYLKTIDPVIKFLQGNEPNFYNLLIKEDFLPKGEAFLNRENENLWFGNTGLNDKAKYYCTLYIQDIINIIKKYLAPHFGFSRYAERIAVAQGDFSFIQKEIDKPRNFIEKLIEDETEQIISKYSPDLCCYSIPFPGNLLGAILSANYIKQKFPGIKILAGGGYVNTELRGLQDTRIFNYFDYITFDDGELPVENIVKNLENPEHRIFTRTMLIENNKIVYKNNSDEQNIKFNLLPPPVYRGIEPSKYLSLIEITNPMHRLWTEGFYNKLTLAHGCYWKKCSFCDTSLDYIKHFDKAEASVIADRMESVISQTGNRMFHFTDEAAPPALLKELAVEIIRRKLVVSWWTNIRFEKAFTKDLCRLLSLSGCIGVSGGLETASERLLKLIDKGVTISDASKVCSNFKNAGIMTHAYLMYGFPTQTEQEIIDSLEIVRQFFENNLIDSAYWHQFALTCHSPIFANPEKFQIEILDKPEYPFANNDLKHKDKSGISFEKYSFGLKKALYNYMLGIGISWSAERWFEFKTAKSKIPQNYISRSLKNPQENLKEYLNKYIYWTASLPVKEKSEKTKAKLTIHNSSDICEIELPEKIADWVCYLAENTQISGLTNQKMSWFINNFPADIILEDIFFISEEWQDLREIALILL